MTPSEVLNTAADLLSAPGSWIQGAYARHANGNVIGARSTNATCFCVDGVIQHVTVDDFTSYFAACDRLTQVVGDNIINWNDDPSRTQAEVVVALREAAAAAA